MSRSAAGQDLGTAWGGDANGVPVFGAVTEALEGVDVLIDYTSHDAVLEHTLTAIGNGVSVVVGSSGLGADQFAEIESAAIENDVAVVAAGNFSITAALAQAAVLLAAKHLPSWEIIDYASASKPDAPSGTARELAERLAEIKSAASRRTGCRRRRCTSRRVAQPWPTARSIPSGCRASAWPPRPSSVFPTSD